MKPLEHIRNSIKKALEENGFDASDKTLLSLEKPKQAEHGDISSTVAMNLAKIAKKAPRQIAQDLVNSLNKKLDPDYITKIDIAGPGFINFYLAEKCLQQSVLTILNEARDFGKSNWGDGYKINFEFVSANPTGPLNIVSARAAAVGDVLTTLFNMVGYEAKREYYINDAGRQVRLLGASVSARYMTELGNEQPVPEDGYHGEYLIDLAKEIFAKDGDKYASLADDERAATLGRMALEYMIGRHKASMKNYRLEYDEWFNETRIREANAHQKVLDHFAKTDMSYEKEDALWFRSSQFGDEKDRVLITSQGEPTYFLIDIAYHQNKYDRGFETLIDFWGPDHHGYIPRMSAALQALGHPKEKFDVSIIQQVNLLRSGKAIKMSKRAGEIVEMDELINEVGVDAARYFFVDRRISQPLDFDIDLAKKQSDENPVFYVQYAHARICNIMRHAQENGVEIPETADMSPMTNTFELALVIKLLDFPEMVTKAVENMEPHRITNYLHETATVFHKFYHENRVVTEDKAMTAARLMLCKAAKQVIANGLDVLGISAPENM